MKTFIEYLDVKGIKEDAFQELSLEKQGELSREYNTELKSWITDLSNDLEAKAGSKDIETLKSEFEAAKAKRDAEINSMMKSMQESLTQHGIALSKVANRIADNGEVSTKSVPNQAKDVLESKAADIKVLINGSKSEAKAAEFSFTLDTKDVSLGGSFSGGNVPVEQRIAGVNNLPTRQVRLLDVIAKGSALSNIISWVYEATETGAVGGTDEGALKNQIDLTWVVDSENVKKRTAFFKATTESLEDVDWVATQLNNNLMKRLSKDVESQVHAGDDVGQNFNGLKTIASPFTPGTFATGQPNAVENPNSADVLMVAMDQIAIADQPAPTFITMYPSDVTALKLVKASSTDKRYVERLTMVGSQLMLDGVPIIATTLESPGEYLIGNGDLATLYDKGQVRIDVGLDGNDFTENKRTILGEFRGCLVVETNDRTAFVSGVFATDITAITK